MRVRSRLVNTIYGQRQENYLRLPQKWSVILLTQTRGYGDGAHQARGLAGILRDFDFAGLLAAIGERGYRVVVETVTQIAVQATHADVVADGGDGIPERAGGGYAIDFGESTQLNADCTCSDGGG